MPPGVAEVTPSVLVMLRSALPPNVSVSVALLLPATGSVVVDQTVAVLTNEPVAEDLTPQLATNVVLAPEGKLTDWLMLPLPDTAQLPPPAALQVQLQFW